MLDAKFYQEITGSKLAVVKVLWTKFRRKGESAFLRRRLQGPAEAFGMTHIFAPGGTRESFRKKGESAFLRRRLRGPVEAGNTDQGIGLEKLKKVTDKKKKTLKALADPADRKASL